MLEALNIKAVSVERTVDVLGLFVKSGQVMVHNFRKNMLEELSRSDYIWGWEWVDILDQDPSSDWNVCFPLRMLSDTESFQHYLFSIKIPASAVSCLHSVVWPEASTVSLSRGANCPSVYNISVVRRHYTIWKPILQLSCPKQDPVLCCPIPPPTPFMSTYLSQGPLSIVIVLFIWYFLWKLIPYTHCLLKKIAHQVLTKSFPFHCEPIAS